VLEVTSTCGFAEI
jgi:hypothetical protein